MIKVFINLVFAWPLLALILHILIPKKAIQFRLVVQTFLILVWLFFSIFILFLPKGPIAIMQGSWPAPFGIALVVDQLSKVMLMIFAISATCINFYSYQDEDLIRKKQAFYVGFWLLLFGVAGGLLTADVFNLYVWFEVMLASAFILLASTQHPKTKALLHYSLMNIFGTLFMLLAIALLYGAFGTLNYADIAQKLSSTNSLWLLPILSLFLFALAVKGALFPLYFWLPSAYPKTSNSSTLMLSSLITKVVMVVLLRLAWLWPPLHEGFLSHFLCWMSWGTMFFGVMGAASQFRFKDILAFHIISQLGYVLLGIVIPLPRAITASLYFLIHNIFVKTTLFMVAGTIEKHTGLLHLKRMGGYLKQHKILATVFFMAAMSLAGMPPLSGFWAKFLIIQSALKAHFYISVIVGIVVSLFTLYSMIKIWRAVFCEPPKISQQEPLKSLPFSWSLTLAVLPLFILPLIMGFWPDSLLNLLEPIAKQLAEPMQYIHLVLGAKG